MKIRNLTCNKITISDPYSLHFHCISNNNNNNNIINDSNNKKKNCLESHGYAFSRAPREITNPPEKLGLDEWTMDNGETVPRRSIDNASYPYCKGRLLVRQMPGHGHTRSQFARSA